MRTCFMLHDERIPIWFKWTNQTQMRQEHHPWMIVILNNNSNLQFPLPIPSIFHQQTILMRNTHQQWVKHLHPICHQRNHHQVILLVMIIGPNWMKRILKRPKRSKLWWLVLLMNITKFCQFGSRVLPMVQVYLVCLLFCYLARKEKNSELAKALPLVHIDSHSDGAIPLTCTLFKKIYF